MQSNNNSSSNTIVVALAGFRQTEKKTRLVNPRRNAELLSMRRHLTYQASVEIDKLDAIKTLHGAACQKRVVSHVRTLLNKEFGTLRVHRYRGLFVAKHKSVEALISSLLRIQFHVHQIELPESDKHVSLTWGVGRTTPEAEVERLRRRRQKLKQ